MARYNSRHSILVSDTIAILREELMRDVFDGAQAPTRIRYFVASGVNYGYDGATYDEFTEVPIERQSAWANISGIIGTVGKDDDLVSPNGRVVVGDTMVTYHYSAISGVYLNSELTQVELTTKPIDGIYDVIGHKITELANRPLCVRLALSLVRNDRVDL